MDLAWVLPAILAVAGLIGGTAWLQARLAPPTLQGLALPGATILIALLVLAAVGSRAVLSQRAAVRAARQLRTVLAERETAMSSLKSAADVLAASEARLRLLLSSAVDGIVELDGGRRVVRANGAFCAMVQLPPDGVVGQSWPDLIALAGPGREGLGDLLETGEATITIAGATSYLEARTSELATDPPGSLLLVRDVTASRVAEQTIRSLFQFLQDRDEDRTRLLKRTNSAIESERNRIARDLHDGPIQGISAASLSLEAVRMMLEQGSVEDAARMLATVTTELSEEGMNLRRVMKDLRPPLLEQRGLIAAVQELCDRAHRELDVPVTLSGTVTVSIPEDVETLGYRVAQEALSNMAKHARASRVEVRIEAAAGTLQVEVVDDGRGFDPEGAREFLRQGKVGLASMRERAELAGGTLTIKSMPGGGTSVIAILPFELLAPVQIAAEPA